LIEPKSKGKFPNSRSDWKWWHAKVPTKLKELHKDGFKVVIFTNQGGIEKKHQKASDITGKILDLSSQIGIPLQALVASGTDKYRKPHSTMWNFFVKNMNGGVKLDLSKCMYVGDAAGRPKGWKSGAKKDFSCGDRTFAANVGVTFKTPEEFFLDEAPHPDFEWDGIDPQKYLNDVKKDLEVITGGSNPVPAKSQEIVLLVGRPASGMYSVYTTDRDSIVLTSTRKIYFL
jgi:bifunctional polynucleotide phosphatase/kinase